ncbi:DNA mismatch repair protein MutS [bacterium]|nr:DNA mismatch repair protein MutS [bacterium]
MPDTSAPDAAGSDKTAEGLPTEPRDVYDVRRNARLAEQRLLEAQDDRLATLRGGVFLSALILLGFSLFGEGVSVAWLAVPAAVFAGLVAAHAGVVRRLDRAKRAVGYYDRALERLADRWHGIGVSGERYIDSNHPYSGDLDIFGRGSLFQLLCGGRTRIGEDTLADWLSHAAVPEVIRERQQSVDELRGQIDFREEQSLLDAEVHGEIDQNRLRIWTAAEPRPVPKWQRTAAAVLGFLAIVTCVGWIAGFGLWPFLVIVAIETLFYAGLLGQIREVATAADEAGSGLAILSQVLELLERQQFSSPLLAQLRTSLDTNGHPPSWQIARLRNLIQSLNNCLQNQFFGPVAFVLGIPVHVVHRVEQWREQVGPHIPDWLAAVGQTEALSSLAGYAFEHPADPFPEIVADASTPAFEGEEIGHPLIPADRCIRNSVTVGSEMRLIMISGSNMSGKSTLLRTVGINSVMAMCGAPVRAIRLRLTPLQVGTAMRVHDSLQDGASLFYSVISRIKRVVEFADSTPPLLFLLDELLQGTNSHDRRVGAEGIIRQLVSQGAIGLVTTHDLALTEIVDTFDGVARNVHLEDHLINGQMYFDYRVRPGVVKKSNALELMRMVGLDVG